MSSSPPFLRPDDLPSSLWSSTHDNGPVKPKGILTLPGGVAAAYKKLLKTHGLTALARDTSARDSDGPVGGETLEETHEHFAKSYSGYYAPVHEVMEASHEEQHPSGVTLYRFDAGDFKIGLHPRIEAELRAGQQRIQKSKQVFDVIENTPTAVLPLKFGPDGVVVVPGDSWPDE